MSDGITTSNGNWYHITREGIKKYIPGLLEKYPLEKLIREADSWLKSADMLSLYLFFVLILAGSGALVAAIASVIFYLLWYFNTGAMVMPFAGPLIKILQMDGVVYTLSGAALIYFSFTGAMAAMWTGILLFFLFKVGLLRLGVQYLMKEREKGTLRADKVLNMLLIRYGMKIGSLTGNIEEMQDELIRVANYHKKKKE